MNPKHPSFYNEYINYYFDTRQQRLNFTYPPAESFFHCARPSMPTSTPFLSVIVATRNRGDKLPTMLAALARAGTRTTTDWELIVVDNGSDDGTGAVLSDFAARAAFPVRVIAEPRPGLSRARNRGVAVAVGDVVAFTDDDCLVAEDWLDVIAGAFTDDPALDLLGGKVVLADPADAPVSLRLFDEPRRITDFDILATHLIGCNVAVRRQALQTAGTFDERLGAGTRSQSAEDLDLFYRLFRAGHCLRYDPRLRLHHAHGRRADDDLVALRRGYMHGRGAFYGKHMMRLDREIWIRFAWELYGLIQADSRLAEPSAFSKAAKVGALVGGVFSRLAPI